MFSPETCVDTIAVISQPSCGIFAVTPFHVLDRLYNKRSLAGHLLKDKKRTMTGNFFSNVLAFLTAFILVSCIWAAASAGAQVITAIGQTICSRTVPGYGTDTDPSLPLKLIPTRDTDDDSSSIKTIVGPVLKTSISPLGQDLILATFLIAVAFVMCCLFRVTIGAAMTGLLCTHENVNERFPLVR